MEKNQVTCECLGCNKFASMNVAGRIVCDECYNGNHHLFFDWPEPLPPLSFLDRHPWVRDAIIALASFYIFAVGYALSSVTDIDCAALKACIFD